jgi:hypothetical protein
MHERSLSSSRYLYIAYNVEVSRGFRRPPGASFILYDARRCIACNARGGECILPLKIKRIVLLLRYGHGVAASYSLEWRIAGDD